MWWSAEVAAEGDCKLLSGGFAALVQLALGLIAISVLVLKRYLEEPRRPLVIWSFDAAKQLIGAGFAHVVNLFIAIVLYQRGHPDQLGAVTGGADQCALYFVNFTLDTTIGVVLNWALLSLFSYIALNMQWHSVTKPGDYGQPVQVSAWLLQLVSWLVIIFIAKLIIASFIVLFDSPLEAAAAWLFEPLIPYPKLELAIVMIVCPCLMNAIQFWIQDSFLKKKTRRGHSQISLHSDSPTTSDDIAHEKQQEHSDSMSDTASESV